MFADHGRHRDNLGTQRVLVSFFAPLTTLNHRVENRRFTSFGDRSLRVGRDGRRERRQHLTSDPLRRYDITIAIERIAPLINLINGDLCYANLAQDRDSHLVGLV